MKQIIIHLRGGLGNQMFIYSFAKFMQQQGYISKIDMTLYDRNMQRGGGKW